MYVEKLGYTLRFTGPSRKPGASLYTRKVSLSLFTLCLMMLRALFIYPYPAATAAAAAPAAGGFSSAAPTAAAAGTTPAAAAGGFSFAAAVGSGRYHPPPRRHAF